MQCCASLHMFFFSGCLHLLYRGRSMETYAYIRVSTKEQNIDRQLAALEPFSIPESHIFCDYQSGKDFKRPAYRKLIRKLKKGDLVIIKSIDRLGRNYNEILEQWQKITKSIEADIRVLDMDLLDTRNKDGNLTGTLIADLVLQIFAYVAQTEREFIRQRQAEGIATAKKKGIRFGPQPLEMPEEFESLCGRINRGEISIRQACFCLNISYSTGYRRYMDWKSQYQYLQPTREGQKTEKSGTEIINYNSNSRLYE